MNPNAFGFEGPAIDMRGVAAGSMGDGGAVIAEDVNWSVARGDFWVVGGLQGTGKTDFLLMTAGLMAPLRGEYYFQGELMPIFDEPRLEKRLRLGIVFDNGRLLNHLTISENISLPLRYHRDLTIDEAEPEARRMLEFCELDRWAGSTPGALARSWQKRAGLARALMLKPDVLLLDNPLGGLDLRHRGWWLRFLDRLSAGHEWMAGRSVTLVVTTDDLRPWQSGARQFAVLKNRRLVPVGGWGQLLATADEHTRELLAEAPPGG